MPETSLLESLRGTSREKVGFSGLDMKYNLKIRSFLDICMPAAYAHLQRQFKLFSMRDKGIAPVMNYVDLESSAVPIAFGRGLEIDYEVRLHRAGGENGEGAAGGGNRAARLQFNLDVKITGFRGSGDSETLGYEPQAGPPVGLGRAQVMQVLTRPAAPPGRRQVTEVPEELKGMKVHPWEGAYPSVEMFERIPEGYEATHPAPLEQRHGVWGLANTDINQHVTLTEYIVELENLFSQLVFAAQLPLERHSITREQLLFRKPFFPGDSYGLQGTLWVRDRKTLFRGEIYKLAGEGQFAERPSISAGYEGFIGED